MNNETEYENFIKNIDSVIYEKMDIDNWNIPIDSIFATVEFQRTAFEDLRNLIIEHPFESKEEEIFFFKYIKPEVLGRLLYFTEVYSIEMRKPHGSIEVIKKHYNDRLDELTTYSVGRQTMI